MSTVRRTFHAICVARGAAVTAAVTRSTTHLVTTDLSRKGMVPKTGRLIETTPKAAAAVAATTVSKMNGQTNEQLATS